jgi:hypothetical protein
VGNVANFLGSAGNLNLLRAEVAIEQFLKTHLSPEVSGSGIKGARFELIPTAPELPFPRRPLGADFQYSLGMKPLTAL